MVSTEHMFGSELHAHRSRELRDDARRAGRRAAINHARRLELLARIFAAGSAWTERRARRYACRARTVRSIRAL